MPSLKHNNYPIYKKDIKQIKVGQMPNNRWVVLVNGTPCTRPSVKSVADATKNSMLACLKNHGLVWCGARKNG